MVDENGRQLGIMNIKDALRLAENRGLDLVEVAPQANPPVCRLMDYGKYKYEQQKEARLHKKHIATVKEVRFHPNTGEHDFQFKAKHAREFILDGHKVKATVIFKGREILHKEFGEKILQRLVDMLSDISRVEQKIRMERNVMSVLIAPDKRKIAQLKQEEENKPEEES